MKFAKFALSGVAAAGLIFASLTAIPTFAKDIPVTVGGAPMAAQAGSPADAQAAPGRHGDVACRAHRDAVVCETDSEI